MERRSLRRSASGPRRSVLQSQDRLRGPRNRRYGAHGAGSVRHRTAALHGRQVPAWFRRAHPEKRGRGLNIRLVELLMVLLSWFIAGCSHQPMQAAGTRMIVVGVDGMDPVFLE